MDVFTKIIYLALDQNPIVGIRKARYPIFQRGCKTRSVHLPGFEKNGTFVQFQQFVKKKSVFNASVERVW